MTEHRHRAARDHRQSLHVHRKGIDLDAVNLVAGECAGQGVNTDILGFNIACGFVDLPIERRYLDLAAFIIQGAERCIIPEQAQDMQPAVD